MISIQRIVRSGLWLATLLSLAMLAGCGGSLSSGDSDGNVAAGGGGGSGGGGTGGTGGPPPPAGSCADFREGYKNVYFGGTHTHTSYSLDAWIFNALNDPRSAHRYAKGVDAAPYPAKVTQDIFTVGREFMIDRPLDWNAVTDHAEFLGGFVQFCDPTPQTQQFCDGFIGQSTRDNYLAFLRGDVDFRTQFLQSLFANEPGTVEAWARTKMMVDEEHEPCTYTTLHGFEYTSNELGQTFHRNVIFRGDASQVPVNVIPAVLPTTGSNPENGNDDWYLFDRLQADCNDAIGCEALTILHNANRSDGRMFLAAGEDAGFTVLGDLTGVPLGRKIDQSNFYFPMTLADAELRRSYDRNFEMIQHKGQSECAVGVEGSYLANDEGYDPDCDFEHDVTVCAGDAGDPAVCAQFCTGDPGTDPAFCNISPTGPDIVELCAFAGPDGSSRTAAGGDSTDNCVGLLDYYRNAMSEGLLIKQTLGINPYRVNVTAAQDTHNGDPGNTPESNFLGYDGVIDDDPREQLGFWNCDGAGEDPNDPANCTNREFVDFFRPVGPGGLGGVWAAENTRDEIFTGLQSGESFGTSGTRLRIRSVASWDALPADVCDQLAAGRDLIGGQVVSNGAAMGGDLPAPPAGATAPHFAVIAVQDPEGYPLQQIDMIKGYLDETGAPKNRVYSAIAATEHAVSLPDAQTCAVPVDNHPEMLCAVWTDRDFNADSDAFWYARALEVPSCRWSDWACNVNATDPDGNPVTVDCSQLDSANGVFPESSGMQGYEGCCEISGSGGVFSGVNRFSPIKERAWASPIWYETP